MSGPPPPLPPSRPAPPVPSAVGNAARAPPPPPSRRQAPPAFSAFDTTSPASTSMPSMPTIAEDTRPQTFPPPPPPPPHVGRIATPAAATSMPPPPAPTATALCGPPYLVQPLYVSKGKNRKVTILAQAGKKRRVSVEEFNRLNGHHGAADSIVPPSMEADEDPMVGSSTMASQAPPPPPAPAPSVPWRPSTPPANMWNIPLVLGTAKKESWWLQEAMTYRERLANGDLRRETRSLVKSASMDALLAEQDGPDRTEPLGVRDGKDRLMELAFDFLEAQTFEDARPGLRAARANWEGQQAEGRANGKGKQAAGPEDDSKLASFGRRLLKKPSAYFRKQSEQ
ncbi:hypothetical protein MMC27_000457 [Xylographa pallens]|nr:hypothetical protein [Xylographa pallens]